MPGALGRKPLGFIGSLLLMLLDSDVNALVSTSARQTTLSGLSEMLRVISEALDAHGCVLWEMDEGPRTSNDHHRGRLFALAAWMKAGGEAAWADIPIHSISGKAIFEGRTLTVSQASSDPIALSIDTIQSFCSTPMTLPDGSRAALKVYRTSSEPFASADVARLESFAALLSVLYSSLIDRVSFSLIQKVNDILRHSELTKSEALLVDSQTTLAKSLLAVVEATSQAFNCIETSIYLRTQLEENGSYTLIATTFRGAPPFLSQDSLSTLDRAVPDQRGVRTLDLLRRPADGSNPEVSGQSEDSAWITALSVEAQVLRGTNTSAPISSMLVPILSGNTVIGLARCSAVKTPPYFLDHRQLAFFQTIAAQIGHWWHTQLSVQSTNKRNQSWNALVESVNRMNQLVHHELNQPSPNESKMLVEAMSVASAAIAGADLIDIRLHDQQTNELYVAATFGTEAFLNSEPQIEAWRNRRFPLGESSAGAYAFTTGAPYWISDVSRNEHYSEIFPGTKALIIAPITSGEMVYGVLDVRSTSVPFQPEAVTMVELLGRQLGLYHYLALKVSELNNAQAILEWTLTVQNQTYQNLQHQFRSPILQADRVLRAALSAPDQKAQSNLNTLRGLIRKAETVTRNVGLYAALAKGDPIRATKRPFHLDDLIKPLSEAAKDHELLVAPGRHLRFELAADSFKKTEISALHLDIDLFDQAISNVLDNAGKYSYADTVIKISVRLEGRHVCLTVSNIGFRLQPDEARRAVEKGWRGEQAFFSTGEGSGIGLWIVDQILKAHDGALAIRPTTAEGITEVQLYFPLSREGA